MLILTVAVQSFVYAQVSAGPKVGVNRSKIYISNEYLDTKVGTGFHIGGFVKYDFPSFWSVQTELVYAQQSSFVNLNISNYVGSILPGTYSVISNYLHLPVLVKYNLGNTGFYLEAGPQAGFYLDSRYRFINKYVTIDLNEIISDEWNSVDFSVAGGLGYSFRNGLTFSIRYCHGLTNNFVSMKKIENKIRSAQLSLAYEFKIRH